MFYRQPALIASICVAVVVGVVDAAELRHMLVSLPAMNYYSSWDGSVIADKEQLYTPEAEAQLASTVQLLLQDHDGDGGASPRPTWQKPVG